MKFIGLLLLLGLSIPAVSKELPRGRTEHRATGCEAFGPGFVKAEGSDSCVKVSGSVRMESDVTVGGGASLVPGTPRR